MIHKRYICTWLFLLSMVHMIFPQSQIQPPRVQIGIILDGYWERNDAVLNLVQKEISALTLGEFDVRFPEEKRIQANWDVAGIESALDKLLNDPQVDMIITLGVIASHYVAARENLPKPVISPFILDIKLQGLPLEKGASHKKNFIYVNIPDRITRDIQAFSEVVKFEELAYLINRHYLEAIPALKNRGREMIKEMGVNLHVIGVDESIDTALFKLPPEVEAVYLGPLTNLSGEQYISLINELNKRKLPSFASLGASDVRLGVLASVIDNLFPKIARRVALNVQRILLGEEPGTIPVSIVCGEQLTLNMATVRVIEVFPDWAVMTEAEIINPERVHVDRKLDLSSAVREAVDVNLELIAKEKFVAAGSQNIKAARSKLFPNLSLSGLGLIIDEDRAEASFGSQAERSLTGSITATQLVFSEPAWANLSIQKSLQKTRELDYEQLQLDISLAAAFAYLNVLRAKTFESIHKENLKITRTNLEIARVRDSVGTAGPAEVFRWESELASNRKVAIKTNALRNLAEIELNRILRRPLEEPFLTVETDLTDPVLCTSQEDFLDYMGDLQTFKIFREFMVEEGLASSPELASLEAAIEAQERALRSASNSFFLPTIAVQGEYANIFSKAGAGSSLNSSPSPLFQFPEIDDTNWSIGLNLSFALFTGGEKAAVRVKAQKELEQLSFQKQAVTDKLEQRIRSALHLAGASFAGINQARKAAEAANKSLQVVQDAYTLGAVSILHLLDAQNQSFNADQAAANATYDFLLDLMEVERAIGRFDFFMGVDERNACHERMQNFFKLKQSGKNY